MPNELKPCKCDATPKIKESYDTLQIVCEHCGEKGKLFVGDYYDEAFMLDIYGDEAIEDWNRRVNNDDKKENKGSRCLKLQVIEFMEAVLYWAKSWLK